MEKLKKSLFKRGAYIYVEGDEDTETVFIVEKGTVELHAAYEKVQQYKWIVKEGEVFGIVSSLCNRPRMTSAIAQSDAVIVAVEKKKFIELIQKSPDIALKIVRNFADELRAYDHLMMTLEHDEGVGMEMDLNIYRLAEYYYQNKMYDYAYYISTRAINLHPENPGSAACRRYISEIDQAGFRKINEPIKNGIYRIYADKQMIFCEYEPGDELYIIKEGKVKIVKVSNNNELLLSVLGPGDIFGEMAIVSDKPRNAVAISWGPTTLLPIKKESLRLVLKSSPTIIYKIFLAISQRIWFTYIRLESRLYAKPVTRLYAFLENKLLEERVSLRSTKPFTLSIGVDDLQKMTGLNPANAARAIEFVLQDTNLHFNFGQTIIINPSVLSSKAKFYRSRDHILSGDDELAETMQRAKSAEPMPLPAEEFPAPPVATAAPSGVQKTAPRPVIEEAPDADALQIPSDEIPFE